jgi:hypothetical protein
MEGEPPPFGIRAALRGVLCKYLGCVSATLVACSELCGLARTEEQAALCLLETTNHDSANIKGFLCVSELLAGRG